MALDFANVSISAAWQQTKANTGFLVTRQGPDKVDLSLSPNTTTYNEVLAVQGTDRTGTTGEQAAARHA